MNIPIVINNFNRLSTTEKLVFDLIRLGYTNIHILDNDSDYIPLLQWYRTAPAKVYYLGKNQGSNAIYNSGYIQDFTDKWIIYTDSDIELNEKTPGDFVNHLIYYAEKYGYKKAGLALEIEDLPKNDYTNLYYGWEKQFWSNELEKNVYVADVDTTFCIIDPKDQFMYKALRVGGNLTARHIPWYTDFDKLNDEEKHYLETSSDVSNYKKFCKSHKNQNQND